MEMKNIGRSYIQQVGDLYLYWDQNKLYDISPLAEYDSKLKPMGEIKQTPHFGAHASGWSVNIEVSAGRSIEGSIITVVTFHAGNDVGNTYYYQTVSDGGGLIDGNVSYNLISYYYTGYEGNFDHTSLLGQGLEITGSLGPFSGGWNVSHPDRYGARVYSQTYGIGIGVAPGNINVRKTKTEQIKKQ